MPLSVMTQLICINHSMRPDGRRLSELENQEVLSLEEEVLSTSIRAFRGNLFHWLSDDVLASASLALLLRIEKVAWGHKLLSPNAVIV